MAKGSTKSTRTPPKSASGPASKAKPSGGKSAARKGADQREKPASKRPVWSGQLRLSLVSVPVQLYSATRTGARLTFHQVHEPTGKRIRYEKIVPGVGPVRTEDIVKGFELDDGRYVMVEPEEIEAAKIEARRTLDLVQFVDHCEIDPIWHDRPYYVVPDGELAEEAFRVLRDAMRATAKVGLGQFVMRGREYVGALRPCGDGMMLETLRFSDEVEAAAPFFASIEDEKADPDLLDLARELIARKSAAFDPAVFVDHYTEALREVIEAKVKHRKITEVGDERPEPSGGQVIDLVEALRRSVKQSGGRETAGSPAAARTRPKRKAGG